MQEKEIRLPFPDFLQRLPFEETVAGVVDKVLDAVEGNPISRALSRLHSKVPSIPAVRIPTPLGDVALPPIALPEPRAPSLNPRRREALKAALGSDLSGFIGLVPGVGDAVADTIEDIFGAKLRNTLTGPEMDEYMRQDKIGPSTLAAIRTFMKIRS